MSAQHKRIRPNELVFSLCTDQADGAKNDADEHNRHIHDNHDAPPPKTHPLNLRREPLPPARVLQFSLYITIESSKSFRHFANL